MRLEFDKSIPLIEQRIRVADSKQPGRKHQKRPGQKVKDRKRATAKRNEELKVKKRKKIKLSVAAYWRGELEEFPSY